MLLVLFALFVIIVRHMQDIVAYGHGIPILILYEPGCTASAVFQPSCGISMYDTIQLRGLCLASIGEGAP